jgi:Fe2+ transport system protein FeoA
MGERFAAVRVRHAPPGGRTMRVRRAKSDEIAVCSPAANGRILNYDHYGRSFRLLIFGRPRGVRRLTVLSELKVGESGVLVALDLPESVQNHLMHMGFVPDALVTALRRAPAGDPTVYEVDGMEIALRHETAEAMRMRPLDAEAAEKPVGSALAAMPEIQKLTEAAR